MGDVMLTLASFGFAALIVWVLVIRPAIRVRRGEENVSAFDGPGFTLPPDFLGLGTQNQTAAGTDLLSTLVQAQHLLVIGPTRAGKTSLIHELAQRWRAEASVLVLDPDAAPGLWAGCDVFGAGDDFAGIDTALAALLSELEDRRRQRARGVRRFAPVRVVMTEAADLMHQCQNARPVFEAVLRRGAKLNVGLVVDVQDRQRKTLDLDGSTHLIQNFDTLVEVRKQAGGRRVAIVKRGEDSTEYAIPQLPDLDKLQAAAPALPAAVLPEPADRQTDRQTDSVTTPETAINPLSVCERKRDAVLRLMVDAGWSTAEIRPVIRGDNSEIAAVIRRIREGEE